MSKRFVSKGNSSGNFFINVGASQRKNVRTPRTYIDCFYLKGMGLKPDFCFSASIFPPFCSRKFHIRKCTCIIAAVSYVLMSFYFPFLLVTVFTWGEGLNHGRRGVGKRRSLITSPPGRFTVWPNLLWASCTGALVKRTYRRRSTFDT